MTEFDILRKPKNIVFRTGVFVYLKKIIKLQRELESLNLDRKKFKPYQKAMHDFILGHTKSVQFERDNEIFLLMIGDEIRGFKHIILKHYGDECEGSLTAREILNFGKIVLSGRQLTDFEMNEFNKIGFELLKEENVRLRKISNRDGLIYKVITYYSSRSK